MGQSFWLYKDWRDYVFQELFFFMSFDAILLYFLFTKLGIVCSWCDCKNWRGCFRSFPASAWELSGTWEQRWLVHLSNSYSYGNNNYDDGSVVDNNLCLTFMFEFFYLLKYSKWFIINIFCYRMWPNAKWSAKDIYSYHGELFVNKIIVTK